MESTQNVSRLAVPDLAQHRGAGRRGALGRLWRILLLGLSSLRLHPLRSILTILGIIIGTGAVIYMLAVIEGQAEETQAKIRARGSTNILVRAKKPSESTSASASRNRMIIYGLTYDDAVAIRESLPDVDVIVPVREVAGSIYREQYRMDTTTFGTVPWFPEVARAKLAVGRWFTDVEARQAAPVAVIGSRLKDELFQYHDPLHQIMRIGSKPFRVIGVLEPTITSEESEGVRRDRAAYIPLSAVRERYGERNIKRSSGNMEIEKVELHQILVRVKDIDSVLGTADAIETLLENSHREDDYELEVPLALLNEARAAARESQILFGAIAGISLLVGGIGIMNIMLASVTERTREIGVRRALGALRRDITSQFLVETLTLSFLGGFIGIIGGIIAAEIHAQVNDRLVIVTPFSVALSFTVSGFVGILSGLYPAVRASRMDPITALRHE